MSASKAKQKEMDATLLFDEVQTGSEPAAWRLTWNTGRFKGKKPEDVFAATVTLDDCQRAVASESGFDCWSELADFYAQIDSDPDGPLALFEHAVQHLVDGRLPELKSLLDERPELGTARSGRSHHAVLPHYIAANGVENDMQRTPKNAVVVAEFLLDRGANKVIDDTAAFYGGGSGSTPLVGLVTSCHPAEAGVQADLVRVFCKHGAKVDGVDDDCMPLASALAFRYPKAARALAECGARVENVVFAAGLGNCTLLKELLARPQDDWSAVPNPFPNLPNTFHDNPEQIAQQAFVYACMCGELDAAKIMLDFGVDVNAAPHKSQTALHEAAGQGHREVIDFLLQQGAIMDVKDDQWNSTPANWASWFDHHDIVELLN